MRCTVCGDYAGRMYCYREKYLRRRSRQPLCLTCREMYERLPMIVELEAADD